MAFLAILRKLQLQRPAVRFTRILPSLPHQLFSHSPPCPKLYFSQAFHQTPCGLSRYTPHIGTLPHLHDQNPYQIIDFWTYKHETPEEIKLGVGDFLERVRNAKDFASGDVAIAFLDNSDVKPDKDFVFSVIWALREEWKLAFLVFKWGEKWDCVVEKTWCLMIWLLGNHKKFSTAWTVIHALYHASKDTQQALLILIDRYVAANLPDKAIETFHLMQKFSFSLEQSTYFMFLNILCTHGNIEEAEEFMFLNKKFFPLETKSFNIILNGWCNITVDIYEAKRIWREMSKCCIEPDGTSYTHIISGYSRVCNLYDSLRLYDQMKKRGWIPCLQVYHLLIYVLTRENCLGEALKIVDTMKEAGFVPNSTTYDLIIRPLCEAGRFDEARVMLTRMIDDDISPTIDTYHALLIGEDLEGTLGVLNHMRRDGLGPRKDTFVLILDKYLKLGESENAVKIWSEMEAYEVEKDCVHYNIMVEGLTKCGLIAKARELYSEMTSDDPSLKRLLEEAGRKVRKRKGQMKVVRRIKNGKRLRCGSGSVVKTGNHYYLKP
ncbi:hypothetical protein ACS0TY_034984 [Phlomoides rotata]